MAEAGDRRVQGRVHFKQIRSLFSRTQHSFGSDDCVYDAESSSRKQSGDAKGQLGLILLNPEYVNSKSHNSTETHLLDIVAIHGIRGGAFKTWTHDNGTNWLKDFLPKAFPGARVFSFGYPAEVFWSRSNGDIDSFARSLLEGLKRERLHSELRSREIFFICHSMGGIVVKKALTIARIDNDDYENIGTFVSAISFLSTPHQGAAIAKVLNRLLKVASSPSLPIVSFTGNVRTDLVKGLEKNAKPLEEISKNFRNLAGGIKIASFVEKSSLPHMRKVIVDDSTGTMGIPGERLVPMLGCDHSTVCRFESEASPGYLSVLGVLQEWAEETRIDLDTLSDVDKSCLKSFAFLEMDWRRSEADKAYRNTCSWILQHESYTEWMSRQRGLLWIKGKPGAGKSTLLAYVYRHFKSMSNRSDLCLEFFFHGRGAVLQKTSLGMFRSLLHQLYSKGRSLRGPIRQAFHEKKAFGEVGTVWDWQLPELQNLLFDGVLAAAESRKVFIFIDALDEAGPDARDLVEYFHRLNDALDNTNSKASICISCRHYPVTAVIPGLDITVEDNNFDDITFYVQATLRTNVSVQNDDQDSKAWYRIEKRIIEDASGVFQWARLVVRMVLDLYREGESWHEIQQMLAKVPRELGSVYEQILNNIIRPERRKRTLHLMQWVLLAERPLTLDELRHAMAFDDVYIDSSVKSFKDTERYLEMYRGIYKLVNSLSGGLAEVKTYHDKTIVQFIHQSVNDFLLSTGLDFLVLKCTNGSPHEDVQGISEMPSETIVAQGHDRLSRSCVNYLKLVEVDWMDFMTRTDPVRSHPPFVEYAAKYWLKHASKAEQGGVAQDHLLEQFGPREQLLEKWVAISRVTKASSSLRTPVIPTLLHIASGYNLRSLVRLLLLRGALVEVEDSDGRRAMHYAARQGHFEVIEILLKANALPDAEDYYCKTPIEWAAINGHNDVVELFLGSGSRIGNTLQAAAHAGSVYLVKRLLDSGADVNAPGEATALQAAAYDGHEQVVQLLLDAGAQINQQGNFYASALQAAAMGGSWNLVQLFLSKGADVNLQGGQWGNALQAAIKSGIIHENGNIRIIEAILDNGANIDAQGGSLGTALQAAAATGNIVILELLISRGAKITTVPGTIGSPLIAACASGRVACVKLLLERGADVNEPCEVEGYPLEGACSSGEIDVVDLLLRNGAHVNAGCGRFGTALGTAAHGYFGDELLEMLLQNGAEVDAMGKNCGTALHVAAERGNTRCIEVLLKYGADVNAKGGYYGTALQAAATIEFSYGPFDHIRLLLERGADVNMQGGRHANALQAAIAHRKSGNTHSLLTHGAILDPQDEAFSKALIAAIDDPTASVEDMLKARGYIDKLRRPRAVEMNPIRPPLFSNQ